MTFIKIFNGYIIALILFYSHCLLPLTTFFPTSILSFSFLSDSMHFIRYTYRDVSEQLLAGAITTSCITKNMPFPIP